MRSALFAVHAGICTNVSKLKFQGESSFFRTKHFQLEGPFVQQAAPYLLMEVTHFGAIGQEKVLVWVWLKKY